MLADRCLTSISFTSFLCGACGKEFCHNCFSVLQSAETGTVVSLNVQTHKACGSALSRLTHSSQQFFPVSRFQEGDLERYIDEMENLLARSKMPEDFPHLKLLAIIQSRDQIKQQKDSQLKEAEIVLSDLKKRHEQAVHSIADQVESPIQSNFSILGPMESLVPPVNLDPTGLESLYFPEFLYSELDDDLFRFLWKDGSTIVVTGLQERLSTQWTPEYFIENYGDQHCFLTDCDTERQQPSTVAEFFQQFGQYEGRNDQILKLKVAWTVSYLVMVAHCSVGLAPNIRL